MSRIVALCGGVGGAKLALGLAAVLPVDALTIVANTGDDFQHLGLYVCPDIDTVLYTLAGRASAAQGWGREEESWQTMAELRALGAPDWFQLGDKDIALHLLRRSLLDAGRSLTEVTGELSARLGVRTRVLPMCDAPLRTRIVTDAGELEFQDYFVRQQCRPVASALRYDCADAASVPDGVAAALQDPELAGIVICPSNPYLSIAPILNVPGMGTLLRGLRVPIVAISPIVAGRALKGPAAKLLRELRAEPSALGVARYYTQQHPGLLDGFLIDTLDADLRDARAAADPQLFVAQTIMTTLQDRIALAHSVLAVLRELRGTTHAALATRP